tara:strand:- start:215 stop:397 length:183 start_codon:yes stop_codon:yes gene_type:complete
MNFLKKNKGAIIKLLVGIFLIFFNYITMDHLPLGKIPAIFGFIVIVKGLIELEFKTDEKK